MTTRCTAETWFPVPTGFVDYFERERAKLVAIRDEAKSLNDDTPDSTAIRSTFNNCFGFIAKRKLEIMRTFRPSLVETIDGGWRMKIDGVDYCLYHRDPHSDPSVSRIFRWYEAIPDVYTGNWVADEREITSGWTGFCNAVEALRSRGRGR